jgi:SAM-dependent methyltransferase
MPVFLDRSWMHFGNDVDMRPRNLAYFLREYTLPEIARFASQRVFRRQRFISPGDDPYDKTNFQPWLYTKGDTLPFDDGSLHYIFSEHFFNMLFFDEVMALLRECHRVLATSGVIRTIVPDSDLRTYEPPEPAGYPKRNIPFTDPRKNKTRYSVYMLTEMLKIAGFEPVPLRYCDREGNYVIRSPADLKDCYGVCPDPAVVFDLSYIIRSDALMVDGVKLSCRESELAHGRPPQGGYREPAKVSKTF